MTSDRRTVFLQEMGVAPLWVRREATTVEQPPIAQAVSENIAEPEMLDMLAAMRHEPMPETPVAPADGDVAAMDWAQLKANVAACVKCGLCQGRTKTVFGVGDEKAKWLFIGEGPGRNEDLRGEPFVGKAGQLLDNMLLAMGLRRGENAYIANVVKCRPTDETGKDRPPSAQEVATCMPYLERQIALIQPTVLVALGKTAALSLLGMDPETPVSRLRGTVHRYAGRPLVVTYHPAYLLRNMADKKKAWADLCLAMATYAEAS
ncbi:MAG TPA: uracil-DNA glycosylase [Noviherbaspirillum sp.]|nr:uracil-DNA glycosylase [Noviherbaspirillum sp.]